MSAENGGVETTSNQGVLALRGDQDDWTPAQRAALVQIGVSEAPAGDQQVFLHVAQRAGLDPFARQIYMICRWDAQSQRNKWTIQTGIDGYRVIAERQPAYGGQLGPQWCGDDGQWRDVWVEPTQPTAARVGVVRKDWQHPIWAVTHFWEFAATKKGGELNIMWATKGRHQIAKCAEAAALRKAFPQDFAGVYLDDEMDQANNRSHRMVVEPEPDIDWSAEIEKGVAAKDRARLAQLWKQAGKQRPGDKELEAQLREAGARLGPATTTKESAPAPLAEDAELAVPSGDNSPPVKPRRELEAHLFALLGEGGVSDTKTGRASRLRIMSRLCNKVPEAESSKEFTDGQLADIIGALVDYREAGLLTETLVSLGDGPHQQVPVSGNGEAQPVAGAS